MNLKKVAAAAAVSLALGVGAVGQAHADAFAGALINITDFTFTDGGATLDISAFVPGTLSFLDTLSNTAQLNGGFTATGGATNPLDPFAAIDPLQACLGACPGQNIFTIVDNPPPDTTFARADNLLSGAPFTGATFTGGGAVPVGVQSATVAETTLNTTSFGGSTSDILLTSQFEFELAQDIAELGIEFSADAFLQAWTVAGSTVPTSAGGDISWSLVLRDSEGTVILSWTPGGAGPIGLNVLEEDCDLNQAVSAGADQPNAPAIDCSGDFSAVTTVALLAGERYSLTMAQHVTSQAIQVQQVPEPSSLLLLGLGMLGLGFVRRRRHAA